MSLPTHFSQNQLVEMRNFMESVSDTNEDTRFKTSQEAIVNAIIELMNKENKTSIVEDFAVPYIHPMITIQKWNVEIKQIIDDLILQG
ncbi:hypothetical protein [Dyadobacter sp. CY312]|uniref:hypothetical protein n=1 Tax=Dyadobacter sp. CY312 TaxID=2907303 RepID=UPI001F1B526D|nr:hypothetical protein [Dyadobacter sp. CY312]MCE7038860.1 hypothetical protein [Dyadobacter sp. CY312]